MTHPIEEQKTGTTINNCSNNINSSNTYYLWVIKWLLEQNTDDEQHNRSKDLNNGNKVTELLSAVRVNLVIYDSNDMKHTVRDKCTHILYNLFSIYVGKN